MKKAPDQIGFDLEQYKERSLILFALLWGTTLLCLLFILTDNPSVIPGFRKSPNVELILYKDLYNRESWPGVEANLSLSVPVVHMYWCGNKSFRFEDYLGLMSVVRVLKPGVLIFLYHTLPQADENYYHTWFWELKQAIPNLVLRHTHFAPRCGSRGVLEFGLRVLAKEGGVYVGERTLLTREPKEAWTKDFYFYGFHRSDLTHDISHGVFFSWGGFPEYRVLEIVDRVLEFPNETCYTVPEFEKVFSKALAKPETTNPCIVLTESLLPRDIWNSTTHFAELARWLYYGKRNQVVVEENKMATGSFIPSVAHIVWLKDNESEEFQFLDYLGAISALHVAGFDRLLVHGVLEPHGAWWERLRKENLTFVKITRPSSVFQKEVEVTAHQMTILKLTILLKYGGAYQDNGVIWVSRLPDDLRRHSSVASFDWARRGEWPDVINMGVVLAKPNADWLSHILQNLKIYREETWDFNAKLLPYKVYEHHPDQLHIDRHLVVSCYRGICHPCWHTDFQREIDDLQPIIDYDWRDARAFHFPERETPTSLTSPQAVVEGLGMFSEMGRFILEKSGQSELLELSLEIKDRDSIK